MKKRSNLIFPIIILLAIVIFAFFWHWQRNTFSKADIKLEIIGPKEASLLEEVEYLVRLKNDSQFALDNPQLIFIAPENSVKDGKIFETQVVEGEELGIAIYPGQEKVFSFKIQLLGKDSEAKIAKVNFSYQPRNLKARYQSETSFTTILKSNQITFDFDLSPRIPAGQDFTFKINYFSNLEIPLSDLRCQIEYPLGFTFISATPQSLDNNEWVIPVLNKSQGGRIEIKGKISGEIGEAKIFKARLGMVKDGKFILLKEISKGIEIIKPLIYLRQEINGNPEYVAIPGDWLHYEIYFKNIGDSDLNNLTLFVKLEGEAFDLSTIKSELGIFHPSDNTIVFEGKNVPKLQYLLPMEEGKVDFWVKVKEDLGNVKDPVLVNKVFLGEIKQEFLTKISTKLEIVQKGYYFDEIFGNTGPLPPTVGQKTTYTILWQVKNYYSDVKDVKVRAKLPEGIELTGKIFPEEEKAKFAFDSNSREIVWSVGDVERGSGILKLGKTIAFQISLIPNESMKGKSPEIISEALIEGFDAWTGSKVENKTSALTTALPDDQNIKEEMRVVK
jgi:hypothetical protein